MESWSPAQTATARTRAAWRSALAALRPSARFVFARLIGNRHGLTGAPNVSDNQAENATQISFSACAETLVQLTQPTPGVLLSAPVDGGITL